MTIQIDLKNLRQADYDTAKNNMGPGPCGCAYAAPCIIGTLVPEEAREYLDAQECSSLGYLLIQGEVSLPEGQKEDAKAMQMAFDANEPERLANFVRKYIPDLVE